MPAKTGQRYPKRTEAALILLPASASNCNTLQSASICFELLLQENLIICNEIHKNASECFEMFRFDSLTPVHPPPFWCAKKPSFGIARVRRAPFECRVEDIFHMPMFEALIDHLHPERHPEIGIIKDIATGGVLISSIGAIVVGMLLLAAILSQ